MAYSELIKDFSRIRNYMRDIYVYAFKARNDFDEKSTRTYDNERRRLNSWLGAYIRSEQDATGKRIFLSVDSRTIEHNPLYEAFRAKSFTDNDLTLYFCVMDLLSDGIERTTDEIVNAIEINYLYIAPKSRQSLEESTVRKKLKEYVDEGILHKRKNGVKTVYFRKDDEYNAESWQDCISFFSEASPLGVIGSFIQQGAFMPFRFKHHYILSALDSEIFYTLAVAIKEKKQVVIKTKSQRTGRLTKYTICPIYFYISTQTGRQYVLAVQSPRTSPLFFRLDLIQSATIAEVEPNYAVHKEACDEYRKHIWGVSKGESSKLEHFSMRVKTEKKDDFVVQRLKREKRSGEVTQIDESTWQFSIDVYDLMELMPWVRMFTGRIISMECSVPAFIEAYYRDLKQTAALYGGETDAVQ